MVYKDLANVTTVTTKLRMKTYTMQMFMYCDILFIGQKIMEHTHFLYNTGVGFLTTDAVCPLCSTYILYMLWVLLHSALGGHRSIWADNHEKYDVCRNMQYIGDILVGSIRQQVVCRSVQQLLEQNTGQGNFFIELGRTFNLYQVKSLLLKPK